VGKKELRPHTLLQQTPPHASHVVVPLDPSRQTVVVAVIDRMTQVE
jgi:hypothetical protein